MRTVWLTLSAACLAMSASAATIEFQVSDLGGGNFRYTYSIASFTACPCLGDTLDLSFDPAIYSTVFNGHVAPATDWSFLLFPPNTPPGAFGDFLVQALVNNPSFAGPFSVDFTLQAGAHAGSQPFTIFDPNFSPITTGNTTPLVSGVPEPATLSLAVAGALLAGVAGYARRRRKV